METKLILGGPGAGKTTRLLEIMAQEIANGVNPAKIAFISFTKKAATEAVDRVAAQFGYSDLPYFRTLHSLAFKELNLRRDMVLQKDHLDEIGQNIGVRLTGKTMTDDGYEIPEGDEVLFYENLSRNRLHTYEEMYHTYNHHLDWHKMKYVIDAVNTFKKDMMLYDFTDMLQDYIDADRDIDVDVVIVDEAQDLSPLQWKMLRVVTRRCARMYVAGDDDQAIYQWAGADVDYFMNMDVDDTETLPISYRLSPQVFNVGKHIVNKINERYEKEWQPSDHEGVVDHITDPKYMKYGGEWLILARNIRFMKHAEREIRAQGIPYQNRMGSSIDRGHFNMIQLYLKWQRKQKLHMEEMAQLLECTEHLDKEVEWYDALVHIPMKARQYYRDCLANGYSLKDKPTVTVDTIHGSKGGEADNVLLMTDITARPQESLLKGGDNEHRVFYVGATRARKRLVIVSPLTNKFYPLGGNY